MKVTYMNKIHRRGLLAAGGALALGSLFSQLAAPQRVLYVAAGEVIQGQHFVGCWKFVCEPGATFIGCLFEYLRPDAESAMSLDGGTSAAFHFELARPTSVAERPILVTQCHFRTLWAALVPFAVRVPGWKFVVVRRGQETTSSHT